MGTEWLSEHIEMMVMDLMQVIYESTPGTEAVGVNLALTLMGKLQATILVFLCPWIPMGTESLLEHF